MGEAGGRVARLGPVAETPWNEPLFGFGLPPELPHLPIRELASPPPAEMPVRPPNGAAEVLSLSTIVGDPAALKPGDAVTLPIFGVGAVRTADAHSVVIELAGGEVREFRR